MMNEKRKPLFARKPAMVEAVGAKLKESVPEKVSSGVVCPKCGHELADTPENREYAASRAEEVGEMDEAEDE